MRIHSAITRDPIPGTASSNANAAVVLAQF